MGTRQAAAGQARAYLAKAEEYAAAAGDDHRQVLALARAVEQAGRCVATARQAVLRS